MQYHFSDNLSKEENWIDMHFLGVKYLSLVGRPPEDEISVRGIWKASDHDNWPRHVAVGVPHL